MYRIASFAAAAALIFGFAISAGPWISASSQSQPALGKIISDAILELEPVTDSGIAVAVIKDGRLYYSGGFGFRDRCASTKVDANTLFGIGSATKAFTSMAISLLAEQNPTLRLDVPVKQYLPDFAMKDSEATEKMTLELILSHRTGLPRHDALWYLGPFTRSQLVYRLRYLDPYPQAFGNVFVYNNMMYMVAGSLLEAVAGRPGQGRPGRISSRPAFLPRWICGKPIYPLATSQSERIMQNRISSRQKCRSRMSKTSGRRPRSTPMSWR